MRVATIISLVFLLSSCYTEKNSSKYSLADGYYKIRTNGEKAEKRYVNNTDNSIHVYATNDFNNPIAVFPQQEGKKYFPTQYLSRKSFDIDFLTMPFKFRPATSALPQQFTTNLNGAVYLGSRDDIYRLSYNIDPLHTYQKSLKHYGISFGVFSGLGGSVVNASTTNNLISSEYDGLVWSKGLAGIIGIDKITVGLVLGFDNLLEPNKSKWIYQNKPWIGLAFGLNIN
jgi:hypothetical protein